MQKKEELIGLPLSVLASLCQKKVVDNPGSTHEERQRAMKFIERFALLSVTDRDYRAQVEWDTQKEVLRAEMADFLSLF